MTQVGDTITIRRHYAWRDTYIPAEVTRVGPYGEYWVKLPGFDGELLIHSYIPFPRWY